MSHFAKVENGVVTQVIVAEHPFISSGVVGNPADWVQTSYNTIGGQHTQGGTPLRGNYAGIGHIYDKDKDVFYAPQPYASWTLNETTWTWEAPVAMPTDDKRYTWDEATTSWVEVPVVEETPAA
jgi:hypothetical protein